MVKKKFNNLFWIIPLIIAIIIGATFILRGSSIPEVGDTCTYKQASGTVCTVEILNVQPDMKKATVKGECVNEDFEPPVLTLPEGIKINYNVPNFRC